MNSEKRPITVEDLLRLKRAERPPAEFWTQFDRELRAKQLAALVEKRPWWRTLPNPLAGLRRYHLPLGATAILVVTFVATRDFSPASSSTPVTVASAEASAPAAIATVAAPAENEPAGASTTLANVTIEDRATLEPARTEAVASADVAVTRQISLLSEGARSTEELTPSAAYIAAKLAAAQAAEPAVARGLLTVRGFDTRVPARPQIEPLAQMASPAERRTARLSSAMVTPFASENRASAVSENVSRRMGDRVYGDDEIRRLSATGNSLGLRF